MWKMHWAYREGGDPVNICRSRRWLERSPRQTTHRRASATRSDERNANGTTVNLSFNTFHPRTEMLLPPSLHCSVDIESAEEAMRKLIKSIHEGVCAWSATLDPDAPATSESEETEVDMGHIARPRSTATRRLIAEGAFAAEQKLAREGRKVDRKAQNEALLREMGDDESIEALFEKAKASIEKNGSCEGFRFSWRPQRDDPIQKTEEGDKQER